MDRQSCDGGDDGDDGREHDDDEPGGAVRGLRRRLGDAHGVDEGVRDKQEEFHGGTGLMVAGSGEALYLLEG